MTDLVGCGISETAAREYVTSVRRAAVGEIEERLYVLRELEEATILEGHWAELDYLTSVMVTLTAPVESDVVTIEPVGIKEIAERLGVQRATVDQWLQRRLLPEASWVVGGRPAWDWRHVEQWARETGRLDD